MKKLIAFYIFGISELQDMYPLIMEAKKSNTCWICFFDCFETKRQLYNYTDQELLSLFEDVDVNVYRHPHKNDYERDYLSKKPNYVFVRTVNPKQLYWYPITKNSKIVHIGYYIESHQADSSYVNIDYTLVNDKKYLGLYKSSQPTIYFGDYRLDNFNYVEKENHAKRCFITESWIRGSYFGQDILNQESKFYDNLLSFLKDQQYEIVWKSREKGYPKQNMWASPLDLVSYTRPDVVIEKDLMLPSSLFYYSINSDLCLVVNDCFSFFDMNSVNTNSYVLKSPLYEKRAYRVDEWFCDELVLTFDEFVNKGTDTDNIKIPKHSNVSKTIFDFINSE